MPKLPGSGPPAPSDSRSLPTSLSGDRHFHHDSGALPNAHVPGFGSGFPSGLLSLPSNVSQACDSLVIPTLNQQALAGHGATGRLSSSYPHTLNSGRGLLAAAAVASSSGGHHHAMAHQGLLAAAAAAAAAGMGGSMNQHHPSALGGPRNAPGGPIPSVPPPPAAAIAVRDAGADDSDADDNEHRPDTRSPLHQDPFAPRAGSHPRDHPLTYANAPHLSGDGSPNPEYHRSHDHHHHHPALSSRALMDAHMFTGSFQPHHLQHNPHGANDGPTSGSPASTLSANSTGLVHTVGQHSPQHTHLTVPGMMVKHPHSPLHGSDSPYRANMDPEDDLGGPEEHHLSDHLDAHGEPHAHASAPVSETLPDTGHHTGNHHHLHQDASHAHGHLHHPMDSPSPSPPAVHHGGAAAGAAGAPALASRAPAAVSGGRASAKRASKRARISSDAPSRRSRGHGRIPASVYQAEAEREWSSAHVYHAPDGYKYAKKPNQNKACHFCDHASKRKGRAKIAKMVACQQPDCRRVFCSRPLCQQKLGLPQEFKLPDEECFQKLKRAIETGKLVFVCPHCVDEAACRGPQCRKRWLKKRIPEFAAAAAAASASLAQGSPGSAAGGGGGGGSESASAAASDEEEEEEEEGEEEGEDAEGELEREQPAEEEVDSAQMEATTRHVSLPPITAPPSVRGTLRSPLGAPVGVDSALLSGKKRLRPGAAASLNGQQGEREHLAAAGEDTAAAAAAAASAAKRRRIQIEAPVAAGSPLAVGGALACSASTTSSGRVTRSAARRRVLRPPHSAEVNAVGDSDAGSAAVSSSAAAAAGEETAVRVPPASAAAVDPSIVVKEEADTTGLTLTRKRRPRKQIGMHPAAVGRGQQQQQQQQQLVPPQVPGAAVSEGDTEVSPQLMQMSDIKPLAGLQPLTLAQPTESQHQTAPSMSSMHQVGFSNT